MGEYMGEASRAKEMSLNMNEHLKQQQLDKKSCQPKLSAATQSGEQLQVRQLEWAKLGKNRLMGTKNIDEALYQTFAIRDPRDELVLKLYPCAHALDPKSSKSISNKKRPKKPLALVRMNMLHLQERMAERMAMRLMGAQPGDADLSVSLH